MHRIHALPARRPDRQHHRSGSLASLLFQCGSQRDSPYLRENPPAVRRRRHPAVRIGIFKAT